MAELRAGLETAEQAVYEMLGLVLPGAVAILGATCVLAPDLVRTEIPAAGAHEWLAFSASYLAGYVVQNLSRPVVNLTRAALALPLRGLVWVTGLVSAAMAASITNAMTTLTAWLRRGHAPKPEQDDETTVKLSDLARLRWVHRLGLAQDAVLRPFDVLNLSFSTLGGEQRRLHRFRAITSLCRAMAALTAIALWLLLGAMIGPWSITTAGVDVLLALTLVFHAFVERADMYDALWNAIILPQFLADSTMEAAVDGTAAAIVARHATRQPDRAYATPALQDVAPSLSEPIGAMGTAPVPEDGGLLS